MKPTHAISIAATLCLILSAHFQTFAQLYINADSLMPNSGIDGQTVDVQVYDLDLDGDLDVILANEYMVNAILYNDGTAGFTPASPGTIPAIIHDSEDIAIADFNGDGLPDIVFVSEDDYEHEYYVNNGFGEYRLFSFLPFTACNSIVTDDFNNDGYPDMFLGNLGQNLILINDSTGQMVNQTPFRLPTFNDYTYDTKSVDVDGDNDNDLFIANKDGNRLLINNGQGVFTDETVARLPQGLPIDTRKLAFSDVDGDGDMDFFLATVEFSFGKNAQNRLFLNRGDGYFTDATDTHLPAIKDQTLSAIFIDVDLDGDYDLMLGGVLENPLKCYLNIGGGHFIEATYAVLGNYRLLIDTLDAVGMVKGDLDGDGLEDVYIANRAGKDVLLLRDPDGKFTVNPVAVHEVIPQDAVKLFPNPATSYVEFNTSGLSLNYLRLASFDGKNIPVQSVAQLADDNYRVTLFGDQMKSGLYQLHLIFKEGKIVKSFVILPPR